MTSPTNPFHSIGARIVVSSGKSENVAIQILDSEVKLGCDVTIEGNNKSLKILGTDSGIDVSKANIGTATINTGDISNLTIRNSIRGVEDNQKINLTTGLQTTDIQANSTNSSNVTCDQIYFNNTHSSNGLLIEYTRLIDYHGFCSFPNTLLGWYYLYVGGNQYNADCSKNLNVSFSSDHKSIASITWSNDFKCTVYNTYVKTIYIYKDFATGLLVINRMNTLYDLFSMSTHPQVLALILSTGGIS